MKIIREPINKEKLDAEDIQEEESKSQNMFSLWFSSIVEDYDNTFMSEESQLLNREECQTCKYWKLIDDDCYIYLSPQEYGLIEQGMEGKIHRSFEFDNGEYDSYFESRFYGFCKRFPPTNSNGTINTSKSLLSRKSASTSIKISEHSFPLMPHDEWCGEWSRCDWTKTEETLKEYIEWAKDRTQE